MRHGRLLIADDDDTTRHVLHTTLVNWGYEVTACSDGHKAYRLLRDPDAPPLALLDWMMPGMDGVEVCTLLRKEAPEAVRYLVLLTTRSNKEDLVEGLRAGADDYVTKPFHMGELRARLLAGTRLLGLQAQLSEHAAQLTAALQQVRRLEALLPICAWCKAVRTDRDYRQGLETWLAEQASAHLAQGLCPSCAEAYGISAQKVSRGA